MAPKKKINVTLSIDEDVFVNLLATAIQQAGAEIKSKESESSAHKHQEAQAPTEEPAPKEPLNDASSGESDPQDTLLAMLGGEDAPAVHEYTHDALKLAARDWVLDAETTEEQLARTNKLNGAIMKTGAKAVSEISQDKLLAFVETLRELGVGIK